MRWWQDPWTPHERRAGALFAELRQPRLRHGGIGLEELALLEAWRRRAGEQPPETIGSLLMLLVRYPGDQRCPWWVWNGACELATRRYSVSAGDALLAARTATRVAHRSSAGRAIRIAVGMLRRTVGPVARDQSAIDAVRALLETVDQPGRVGPGDRALVRGRLLALLPPPGDGVLDTAVIVPCDAWSAAVRSWIEELPEGPGEVTALLRHLGTATGSKPARSWQEGCERLLRPPVARATLRALLEKLADTADADGPAALDERNDDLARAAAWAAIGVDEPWVAPALERIGNHAARVGDKVFNASVLALGAIGATEAVAALWRLRGGARHGGHRKRVDAALTTAAAAAGLTPGQLVERMVPTGGLRADGTAPLAAGAVTARASVDGDLKVTVTWASGDRWVAKPPAGSPAGDVAAVRRRVRELRAALAAERRRVEDLLATDRTWEVDEWRRWYLEHPVTGRIARRLLWRFNAGHGPVTAMPGDDGKAVTLDGDIDLPAAGTVTLWHPAAAPSGEVGAWRSWLVEHGLRQPFKQVFREAYPLTPAELETGTYSNRFAAHVLRYRQVYALFRERGWVANFLGPFDGGYDGQARHDFPEAGLSAVFEHFPAGDLGPQDVELCGTDRVWFHRTGERRRRPLDLREVPPLVFSEAMRDVDLFVSVASIALDPEWADRGADVHYSYWMRVASGPLSPTGDVRRDLLARLLPKLKIADRLELDDRFLRVRGNLGTYKVHLGSGAVIAEADGRYLCIVPARGRARRVMLPLEGDEILSLVLSKALLLAADDQITDPSIRAQLPRR